MGWEHMAWSLELMAYIPEPATYDLEWFRAYSLQLEADALDITAFGLDLMPPDPESITYGLEHLA